jgi:hypothetical protein
LVKIQTHVLDLLVKALLAHPQRPLSPRAVAGALEATFRNQSEAVARVKLAKGQQVAAACLDLS